LSIKNFIFSHWQDNDSNIKVSVKKNNPGAWRMNIPIQMEQRQMIINASG